MMAPGQAHRVQGSNASPGECRCPGSGEKVRWEDALPTISVQRHRYMSIQHDPEVLQIDRDPMTGHRHTHLRRV